MSIATPPCAALDEAASDADGQVEVGVVGLRDRGTTDRYPPARVEHHGGDLATTERQASAIAAPTCSLPAVRWRCRC
jgi:hypothetical protein